MFTAVFVTRVLLEAMVNRYERMAGTLACRGGEVSFVSIGRKSVMIPGSL